MTSFRSKRASSLLLIPCLGLFLGGSALAQETNGAVLFQVSLKQEPITREPPSIRAYLTAGTAKLAFIVPDYFQAYTIPTRQELLLSHKELGTITVSLVNTLPATANGLSSEGCRAQIAAIYPGATILEEFSKPIGGPGNRMFDVKWTPPGGVLQYMRVAFVRTPAGMVLLRASANPENFPKIHPSLDLIMTTLTGVASGELRIVPLSDQI